LDNLFWGNRSCTITTVCLFNYMYQQRKELTTAFIQQKKTNTLTFKPGRIESTWSGEGRWLQLRQLQKN
jgi:hypothetical protein